ncbi:uncharacterized protein BJ171DRAFT_494714 [Polychytrium aggregatum]|uniref:uncharacterized protein n=1 Tax=Polychytrium aggregatum TaxID=110093 RepID=UPI0022FF01BD|nr:uncharacterized protein BJ171DRAFT_494714 [Polychytrium aggregatum]KAI9207394.1 hypothetical protein BJ171DRAFT_494714 [Polychytrium aggregatum]
MTVPHPMTSAKYFRQALDELNNNNLKQLKTIHKHALDPIVLAHFCERMEDLFYKEALGLPDYTRLAYFNDMSVGGIVCRKRPSSQDGKLEIQILTLAVLEAYRNLGLGTKLVQNAIDQATADSAIAQITVYIPVESRALSLFERLGFAKSDQPVSGYFGSHEAWLLVKQV